ncbi:hypothetical protein C8F01DRAFT_1252219 [Mycena amicta]|nr:hypothetical protein C8F01DRAFT_1252219 [Mycena amicta]
MSHPSKSVRFALAESTGHTEPIVVPDSNDDEDTKLYAAFQALAVETPSSAASPAADSSGPPPPGPTHSRPVRPPVPTHSRPPIAPIAPPANASSSNSSTALYLFPTSGGPIKGVATALRRNTLKKPKPIVYMVARGHRVCVSSNWDEVKQLTSGFSHNLFEGYPSHAAAEAALEWLCSQRLTSSSQTWSPCTEDIPMPCTSTHDLAGHGLRAASDTWHIVYVGINPGVFPTSAEAAVNVVGVKGGLRDHRDTYAATAEVYAKALAGGYVAQRSL